MTLSLSRARVLPVAVLAAAWTTLTFGALTSPVEARGNTPFYTAELAAPAKEARTVAGGVVWQCEGTTCVAAKGTSRPVVMCMRLNRELGDVASFKTKGKALADEKLARCNGE
ncbi:hypothetical protein [Erythrobacter sp. HKB08]|uniref:CC_3452 family protein n=1 Tax=Erythrobacter sp. HKB08 TaxID=2502843 RepID=UPI0010090BD8|nr:hypothetical protein [Erythrobacter sp. HKB08]